MATISHKSLSGTQLHETKGVSAASDDFVLTATSAAGVWKKLTASNLTGTGNPFGGQLYHGYESQAAAVASGISVTSGSWVTVPINTSVTNEITSASLASNQISLPAGTYFAEGFSPAYYTAAASKTSKLRIRNVTDGTTLRVGRSWLSTGGSTAGILGLVTVRGRFTLSGTKTIELQFWQDATTTTGFGNVGANTGEIEVYGEIMLWKVA